MHKTIFATFIFAFRYIAVHEISASQGPSKSLALPFFYSFLGCDTTSSFFKKGKLMAQNLWQTMPEVIKVFQNPGQEIFLLCLFGGQKSPRPGSYQNQGCAHAKKNVHDTSASPIMSHVPCYVDAKGNVAIQLIQLLPQDNRHMDIVCSNN